MPDYFIWLCAIAIVSLLVNVVQYWILCQTQCEVDELQFTLKMRQEEAKILNDELNNTQRQLINREQGAYRVEISSYKDRHNYPHPTFAEMTDNINRNS